MTKKIEKAQKIVAGINGKNVAQKRRDALLAAGYEVGEITTKWNFGTVGAVKEDGNGFWIQVAYATGGKSKSGYGVNACPCVFIFNQ